jgi:transmembrane sensor
MADEIEWELVTRYMKGECDAEEAARVERWLERPEVRRALGDALREVDERAIPVPSADVHRASARMRQAMGVEAKRATSSHARHTWLIAAGLMLAAAAIGSGVWWWRGREMPAEWRMVASGRAERRSVSLGGAGEALLAPESRIRWRASGDEKVEVRLDGEARFEVRHGSGLVVRARNTVAEDIGTTFLVVARRESDAVRVTVVTGAVRLRDTLDATWHRVGAGEQGSVSGPTVRVEPADTTQAMAWTRGRLAFVSTPLREVARELERWFDVRIAVDSSIASRRLTGEFGAEAGSFDEILLTISAATDVRYEREAGRVVLRARR